MKTSTALPASSTAVQLTVVVPTGNTDPDGGVQVTVGAVSTSSLALINAV